MNIVYESKTLDWTRNKKPPNSSTTTQEILSELHKSYRCNWKHLIKSSEVSKNIDIDNAILDSPRQSIKVDTRINIQKLNISEIEYIFTDKQYKTLLEASKVGAISGHYPMLYDDELQEIAKCLDKFNIFTDGNLWFSRLDECSFKDGLYNPPYTSSLQIIKSLVTSQRVASALQHFDNKKLYLIPWNVHWDSNYEFRVFVYNKKVTCISQYKWIKNLGFNEIFLGTFMNELISYCNKIANEIDLQNMIIDVVYNDNPQFDMIELVEINSFNKYLTCGALFDWELDENIIYSNNDKIIVRYVTP